MSIWNRGIRARCMKRAWRRTTSLLNKRADQEREHQNSGGNERNCVFKDNSRYQ
jgi:hypothetical protein